MASRLETNFKRLLARCENVAKNKDLWDWRLEKYIIALQDQFNELKKSTCRPCQESLNDYGKKLDFLKGILEAEKLPSKAEKALATEKLASVSSGAHNSAQSKALHLQTKSRYQKEARDELLGNNEDSSGVRQRKVQDEGDVDSLIQHHHQMQERLADEMLMLARNLKDSVADSGRIVREDTKKILGTTKMADVNYDRLKKESERLEKHTQTCNWWMWLMLVLVILTFLSMILFMKLFPKKTPPAYPNYVDDASYSGT